MYDGWVTISNFRSRLDEDVVKEVQGNDELHEILDEEYDQLLKDRQTVRFEKSIKETKLDHI